MDRAIIGVDGDWAFALLGENLQEGEAEFVEVVRWGDETKDQAQARAAKQALKALKERLGKELTYALDPSHPRYL